MLLALNRRRPPGRRFSRGSRLVRGAVAACLALAVLAAPVLAEDMPLSPDLQLPIILTLLKYDRHFDSRFGSELDLGVLYVPGDPESVRIANSVAEYLYRVRDKTVKGLPVKSSLIEYTTPENLERSITTRGLDVIYVAPGNARNIAAIIKITQARSITTVTGVPDYVRSGVAVGIGRSQDRAQIIINLPSSKAEGAEFDASLLRIATIVK